MKREPIYKEIAGVINALVENATDDVKNVKTYVYNGFLDTEGHVVVNLSCKSGNLDVVVNGEETSMSKLRTRDMLWIRNSLFRDYGKRVFRCIQKAG